MAMAMLILRLCRVAQLARVSGKGAPDRSLLQKLLDSDFDPAAWDHHMSAAFDDDYYAGAWHALCCMRQHLCDPAHMAAYMNMMCRS
jgi:hypothetical protein